MPSLMHIVKMELANFYSSIDGSGGSVFTKEFTVYFEGPWDPINFGLASVIVDGVTIPGIGVAMAEADGYYVSNVTPKPIDLQAGVATVLVQFKSGGQFEMLSGAKDVVAWEDAQQQREVCFDFDGKPIVNRARQVFAQNAPITVGLRACTITGVRTSRKLPPVSKWKIVNAGAITIDGEIFAAGKAWMTGARCETIYVQNVKQYLHNWSLVFSETHDLEVPNIGTVELDNNGKAKPITVNGVKMNQPWPLTGDGYAFPANYDPSSILKLTFKVTESYSFANFGWKF